LVSPFEDDDKFHVGIVNDRLNPINGELQLRLMDFDGKVIWEYTSPVDIPANSSKNYFDTDKHEFRNKYHKQLSNLVFTAELLENGKVLSKNSFFFEPFKKLKIEQPTVKHSITKTESGFNITLQTDKLAKNIYLQIGDEKGFFSDNYFDLLPGKEGTINLKTKITEDKLKEVFTIRTLDDAF
jgi:beta-mannosidase